MSSFVETNIDRIFVQKTYHRTDVVAQQVLELFLRFFRAVEGKRVVGAQHDKNLVAGWTGLQQLTLQILRHAAPRIVGHRSMRIDKPNGSVKRSRRPGVLVWRR